MPRVFENVDSKYKFIVLASERSRQLIDGARPKVESSSKKPTIIAIDEVLAGVIEYYYEDKKVTVANGEEDGKE